MLSGLASLPKFGVMLPLASTACTVTAVGLPAVIVAGGATNAKPAGATTTWSVAVRFCDAVYAATIFRPTAPASG